MSTTSEVWKYLSGIYSLGSRSSIKDTDDPQDGWFRTTAICRERRLRWSALRPLRFNVCLRPLSFSAASMTDCSREIVVGERGFEPPAPASRRQCSTRLSYSPTGTRSNDASVIAGARPRLDRGGLIAAQAAFQRPRTFSQSSCRTNFSRGDPGRARSVSDPSILRQSS
jgi:hypothetical protein